MGANVMSNQACRECGAYIGESAFCERCGRQRADSLAVGGLGTSAAQRLGVSYAPPSTPVSTVSVAMPTYSESVSAWSSESVNSSGIKPPKRFSIVRILVTGALLVLAGKGAIVGYGLAKEAVEPAPLAKGDCISFDASGANPHVSSCGEIHFGEVVKEVKHSDDCAGLTDFWIQKKDRFYCIKKTG